MRPRTWLLASVALNVALAATLVFLRAGAPVAPSAIVETSTNPSAVKTNVLVRQKNFTWHEVESTDYAAYVRNLRGIGCPEQTIRDIIVADVNEDFARRRAAEVGGDDIKWWRSEPDLDEAQQRLDKLKLMDDERRALLTKLLGPDWDKRSTALPSTTGINLTGAVLGQLSSGAKDKVYDIVGRAQQARDAYVETQRQLGMDLDQGELARLRQETRRELSQVLNSSQLEEFLLRYSQTAQSMRNEFRGTELTPDEFRAIFRVRDTIEQERALLANTHSSSVRARFGVLQSQMEEKLRQTLGVERYTNYKLNQDPMFRETKTIAERLGVTPQVMFSMYEINQVSEAERQRIQADVTLSSEEQIEELAMVQAEQQKSLGRLLGDEGFQKLRRAQAMK